MAIANPVGNLGDLALEWAQRTPDALAISDRREFLSYRALENAVRRAAQNFLAVGWSAGHVIGIAMHATPIALHLAATLALARIGAVQILISPDELSPVALGMLARRHGIVGILTDQSPTVLPSIQHVAPEMRWLDPLAHVPQRAACAATDGLAWLISRSSGTTGSPKAMLITHALELQRKAALHPDLIARPGERTSALSMPWFYVSLRTALYCLGTGGHWIALPWQQNAENVLAAIDDWHVSNLHATPIHIQALLPHLGADAVRLPEVRALRVGTGALAERVVIQAMTRLTPNLYVTYGSNEAPHLTVATPSDLAEFPLTVGRPCTGVQFELVGQDDRPVTIGEEGEVRVRSPSMVEGYVDDAEETAKRFRDGWYYPGDAARMDGAGRVFLIGRTDDLLNFDGVLLSPLEIEAAILEHPAVTEAAVFAMLSEAVQDAPYVAVVLRWQVPIEELLQHCRARIGRKAPVGVMQVKFMPRNQMGKVLRRSLREMAQAALKNSEQT